MPNRRPYSFYIDEALDVGLKALKVRDGMPEAEAIRRAIAEFLRNRGIAFESPRGVRKSTGKRKGGVR
jgi:hypothetical protein